MKTHLYIFGYSTCYQVEVNDAYGWDDEDSAPVFIVAPTPEEALAWGVEISEAFIHWLFKDSKVSWKAMGFAYWIEEDPEKLYEPTDLKNIQTVQLSQFPDFEELFSQKGASPVTLALAHTGNE